MQKTSLTIALILLLLSCATTQNDTYQTYEDQSVVLQKKIEDTTAITHQAVNYKSIAFGELTIYKPNSFYQLDSLYKIKKEYMDNKDWRGLKKSGIDAIIPLYQANAKEDLPEVQYEIEHIFSTEKGDSTIIHHTYFVFDYQKKITLISPLYHFNILNTSLPIFYAYQFNNHFLTSRNLYISKDEWEFLQFLKIREKELIGSPQIQTYMGHVLNILQIASEKHTLNFETISKSLIIQQIQKDHTEIESIAFTPLYLNKDAQGNLLNYTMEVELHQPSKSYQKIQFTFSPYLEIISMDKD